MDLNRYRSLFVDEARRLIQRGETLVSSPMEEATASAVFRVFHTLKGMAATMSLPEMTVAAHAMEDVCDGLVRSTVRDTASAQTLLLDGLAWLARQVAAVEEGRPLEAPSEVEQSVRRFLTGDQRFGFRLLHEDQDDDSEDTARIQPEVDRALAAMVELLAASERVRELTLDRSDIAAEVDRIQEATRTVYDHIVRLREVPFGTIVPSLRQQVRRASDHTKKLATLDVRGDAVEVDRHVLGTLQGALVHLIQNAVVHGIEAPAVRRTAKKMPTGRITLEAQRMGRVLLVTLSDDGSGFDAEALSRSAGRDGDPVELAFATGVTTADRVDAFAGRGIGMGVVRETIKGMGGRMTVASVEGHGVRITLQVPTHADLVALLIVEVDGTQYALRGADVEIAGEDPNVPPLRGLPVTGRVALSLRDGRQVRVDRMVSRTETLVSPPPFPINRIPGITGTTIAPDGRVLFVLDP